MRHANNKIAINNKTNICSGKKKSVINTNRKKTKTRAYKKGRVAFWIWHVGIVFIFVCVGQPGENKQQKINLHNEAIIISIKISLYSRIFWAMATPVHD